MGDDELIKFLKVIYEPEHERVSGYLSIRCLIKEFGVREIERSFIFQYDIINKKVFFRVYPTLVLFFIGNAGNVDEATEQAKEFLSKWIGDSDIQFKLKTAKEIRRLEEEKRSKSLK